ncbi:ABC transporter ATP-binding protein [Clostridium tagluense]|uniref:ABC transporter ATP-binding protein n=1 Tax=Clostridium tagluense TaxID=360422 RepID=UPI001C0DF251|nr:ABC transporter ATP-binding protein [Clostridium tagluense]MBU3129901.1 ABC transporter ATP-binding protein [Clostridium tagluense]MCB2313535.1 ABC transporter ATP-binding protein [Clostridium tagluense]MCB2318409.1 ABC transporter ATP-binding protein [Clostridium tagluense]MCB2323210.1 ABC transporter ATP-binding protein [Clostridium tagluense]MCB2328143.1 ABC transporter ATP-binding protein [Clostridium tagluense]
MSKLQIKNLNKSFDGIKVLKDINFFIDDGEIVSLLGESGCGKSTTLKIIAGLIELDSGDIILDECSILSIQAEKRKTVIVFQDHLLFPHLNIEDNIGFGLKMAGIKKSIRKNKVAEIISLLKLQGLEKRYSKELSGGQRQRVALGRALAIEPTVLLLDEPFSSLDIRLREEMRELVLDIQKKLRITTILVTHDKEEALMMSDKIAVMINGKIVQFDTPENVYEKPASPLVADFFGEKNYIEGSVSNGTFECKLGSFQVELFFTGNGQMMIRPENIELLSEVEGYSMSNIIKGVVKKRRYLGDKAHYTVEVEGKEFKAISSEYMKFNIGEKVKLKIDFSKGIVYPMTNRCSS